MTLLWLGTSLFNIIIGLLVMLFYFNRSRKSTGLWIPRAMAEYLRVRTKKTKRAAEAFTLGAGSVLAEAPFLIAPLMVAILYSLTSVPSTSFNRLAELGIYSVVSLFPLIIIVAMVGAGHKISTIQRWREDNKLFLQYCAGAGLVILGAFVYVDKVMGGAIQ
jgi:cytochrome c biogenesis protein CcdA